MLMFIPRAGGLMALYELMEFLHLRNSHLGLILLFPSAISVALFVMRQNFLGVPRELEEAAIIDGAGTWRLFLERGHALRPRRHRRWWPSGSSSMSGAST